MLQRARHVLLAFVVSAAALIAPVIAPNAAMAATGMPAATTSVNPTNTGESGRTPFTAPLPESTRALRSNVAAPKTTSPQPCTKDEAPSGVKCQVIIAALADGGCNWSPANRPYDLAVYGINEHTTEGTVQSALDEAQNLQSCISWNALIGPDGTLYVQVPYKGLPYDVGNWWWNTHYIQVEMAGKAEDCSTLTSAEYNTSVILDRWLIWKFHIHATSATITGHDSVTAVNDHGQPAQHWDPGVCWPWAKFLADVGAPILPTALPNSPVVTIDTDNSMQPVQNCPGAGFTSCVPAAQATTNFLALYTEPNTSAPLVSDPYLHSDSSAGSTAMQDWGDKAPTGHDYVVINRIPGWTEIWYGGQPAWFQNNGHVTVPTAAFVVTPKGNTPVAIYGRPMPEYNASGWASIPYDHQSQVALTLYQMQPGQQYPIAAVPWLGPNTLPGQVSNDYAEGCNLADCSGPGDTTVVHGSDVYLEISWDHRWAFVRASDVNIIPVY